LDLVAILVIHLLAIALVWACGSVGATFGDMPVFYLCALLIFVLQWLAFVPAYLRQTEKYYDLTGSLTFVLAMLLGVAAVGVLDARSLLLSGLVIIWAARLGSFLFQRIQQDGHDSRFDKIKPNPVLFLRTWSLQGLWVLVTAGAALAAIANPAAAPLGVVELIGVALWLFGFGVEVIADRQKRLFRSQGGDGTFITSGLWSRSRHPNYLGEIVLWAGVALIALPALEEWQYLSLVSPVFVYILLTRISGIPLLERKADRRWGDDPEYQRYKESTPVLLFRF
jgi:steroid 5-alpha reductase family enzyme